MVNTSMAPPVVRGEWLPMSWEEFLAWAPDEGQAEWVDGEGIAYVSNTSRHVRMVVFLSTLIASYLRVIGQGEVFIDHLLMQLPNRPAGRMPDIVVLSEADRVRLGRQWLDGPALLVVEFVSDDSVDRDKNEKRDEYEAAGVREYLIIDSRDGQFGVLHLHLDARGRYRQIPPDQQGRIHPRELPGFWFDPAWLDQEPTPNVDRLMLQIMPEAYREYLRRLLAE